MMTLTINGLLRTAQTVDELAAMQKQPATTLQTWFCPFGYHTKEWVENRECFKALYLQLLDQSEIEFAGDQCREGVFGIDLEESVWAAMSNRFVGPIGNCPSPQTRTPPAGGWWYR